MAEARLTVLSLMGMDGGEDGVANVFNWIIWLPQVFLVVAALMLVFRFVRNNRDVAIDALRDHLKVRWFSSRGTAFAIKLTEVLREVILDVVLIVLWNIGLTFLEPSTAEGAPLIILARVLVGGVLIYRITMGMTQALVLPGWYRLKKRDDGEEVEAALQEQDDQSVDLFSMEIQRAKFIVSTMRFFLLYTLICQYSLFLIRQTFGMFFIGRWMHVLGYLGYGIVVYVLLSLWKDFIAAQFTRLAGERWGRAAAFINKNKERPFGVLVIFVAFLYVLGQEIWRLSKRYIFNLAVTRQAINFIFRKRIEMEQQESKVERPDIRKVPVEYRRAFEDRPLDADTLERINRATVDVVSTILEDWQRESREGAVALISERGLGKSSVLNAVVGRFQPHCEIIEWRFEDKIIDTPGVLKILGELFGLSQPCQTSAQMVKALMAEPRRLIVLDGCHNLFLRKVGGFSAITTFLEIVGLTKQRHGWLMAFNSFSWHYINRLRDWGLTCNVVELKGLSDDDIRALIEIRSAETGVVVDFSRLRGGASVSEIDGEEGAISSARGYYRLLAEHSRGNPRVAMAYWLRSLRPTEDPGRMEVALFQVPVPPAIKMGPDYRFMLAAIVQHDSLNAEELREIVNVDGAICSMALEQFHEMGIIEINPDTGRVNLEPVHFQQILKHLRTVNFLFN